MELLTRDASLDSWQVPAFGSALGSAGNTTIDGAGLPQATLDGFFVLMVLAGNDRGNDAERNHGKPFKRSAGKHVEHVENRSALLIE